MFLFSAWLDASAFCLPLLLAAGLSPYALSLPPDSVPLLAHFLLVVAVDVAHVYATLFRTYLDRRELVRRKALLCACPLIAFVLSLAFHLISPRLFWTVMAYYAMYHFVKQDFGLLALFVARAGSRPSKGRMRLEKYTLYAGAVLPILIWHSQPPERFNWFGTGEKFIFTTPPELLLPLKVTYCLVACNYAAWEVWAGTQKLNPGKLFIMMGSWLTWGIGTSFDGQVLTLGWLNLFHGIPFIVMVGVYCRNRWATLAPIGCSDRVIVLLTKQWRLFIPCLVLLGLLEDLLWDIFVWQDYVPLLWEAFLPRLAGELPELGPVCKSVAVSLLSVPQVVHYILDGYIWKFDSSNPGLREFLLASPAVSEPKPLKQEEPSLPPELASSDVGEVNKARPIRGNEVRRTAKGLEEAREGARELSLSSNCASACSEQNLDTPAPADA